VEDRSIEGRIFSLEALYWKVGGCCWRVKGGGWRVEDEEGMVERECGWFGFRVFVGLYVGLSDCFWYLFLGRWVERGSFGENWGGAPESGSGS
jgi:hypothetical protein